MLMQPPHITSEIGTLETLEGQAQGLEGDVIARDGFFGAGGATGSSGFAIGTAITLVLRR